MRSRKSIKSAPEHVQWLHGYVGCGKSAIAQTVADQVADTGRLAGSFFCFRADDDRNKISNLPNTLAYQLAGVLPKTERLIRKAVEKEPGLVVPGAVALDVRMRHLVYEPFRDTVSMASVLMKGPFLIIIDGLDECEDYDHVEEFILGLLSFFHSNATTPLRFLIASRVEEHIRQHLQCDMVAMENLVVHGADPDIKVFLKMFFSQEADRNRVIRSYGPEWPSEEQLNRLVKHINGSFIFASTFAKYIVGRPDNDPRLASSQLAQVQSGQDGLTPVERLTLALDINPGLDGLYAQTLSRAEHFPHFPIIIASLSWIRQPLTISDLARMTGIDSHKVTGILLQLQAIIQVPDHDNAPVALFHASLGEFLQNKERAGRFYFPMRTLDSVCERLLASSEGLSCLDNLLADIVLWGHRYHMALSSFQALMESLYPLVHHSGLYLTDRVSTSPILQDFLAYPTRSKRWHLPVDSHITRILSNAASTIPHIHQFLAAIVATAGPHGTFNAEWVAVLIDSPLAVFNSHLHETLYPLFDRWEIDDREQPYRHCPDLIAFLLNPTRSREYHVSPPTRDIVLTQYLTRGKADPLFHDILTAIAFWGEGGPDGYLRILQIHPDVGDEMYLEHHDRLIRNRLLPPQVSRDVTWLIRFLRDEQRSGEHHVSRESGDHLMARILDKIQPDLWKELIAAVVSPPFQSKGTRMSPQMLASYLAKDLNDVNSVLEELGPFVIMTCNELECEIEDVDNEFLCFVKDKERSGKHYVDIPHYSSRRSNTM